MRSEFPTSEGMGLQNIPDRTVRLQHPNTGIVTRKHTRQLANRFNDRADTDVDEHEASTSELYPPDFSVLPDEDGSDDPEPYSREERQYVIDRVIDHGECDDNHPTSKSGETLYRVRWYGFEHDDDTWEPIDHFSIQKLLSYYRRRRLVLPSDIDRAKTGSNRSKVPTGNPFPDNQRIKRPLLIGHEFVLTHTRNRDQTT